MHNRLKVRTSAEMQEINKRKEQEKARTYSSTMKELFNKRHSECHDSVMSLSAEILHMNPDVSTVWNIRKEFLLKLQNDDAEKRKCVVNEELKLTEAGLRVNPKSYGAWYHRCWILNNFGTKDDWTKELQICTKYLEMDERNFHCWDYRKYVVELLNTQLEKELDFSLQKLSANFSNYSAWHYRSKLIPRIHPDFKQKSLFESDIYEREVSLVENAVYTDPNDQSAWFYHRWLLSYITNPVRLIQAGFDRDSSLVWAVIFPFSPHVQLKGLGDEPWEFLNGKKISNVLIKQVRLSEEFSECIKLLDERNEEIDSLMLTSSKKVVQEFNLKSILTLEERKCLKQQLTSYRKLSEMEANLKWPLLANAILNEKLGNPLEELILEKLQFSDYHRKSYYTDLISRCKIENILSSIPDFTGSFPGCCSGLTAFYHNYYFTLFKEIDLSKNPLGNNVIRKLDTLLSCEILNLADCKITSIDGFPVLPNLRVLDLSYNNITSGKLPGGLLKCTKLEFLNVTNSIQISHCREISSIFKTLKIQS